jgi:hypothetical protein
MMSKRKVVGGSENPCFSRRKDQFVDTTPKLRAIVFDVSAFYIASLVSVTQCRSVRSFQARRLIQRRSARCRWLWSVCSSLGLKVVDDPATRPVAEKIIALSQHGVRGVATLRAMTVKEFQSE